MRNIYFPFHAESDTALSVATEMVGELDITDQDVTKIAEMIDGEMLKLVPQWKTGPGIEENPHFDNSNLCHNCVSTSASIGSYIQMNCEKGCGSKHGRFEEYTYAVGECESLVDKSTDLHHDAQSKSLSKLLSGVAISSSSCVSDDYES